MWAHMRGWAVLQSSKSLWVKTSTRVVRRAPASGSRGVPAGTVLWSPAQNFLRLTNERATTTATTDRTNTSTQPSPR